MILKFTNRKTFGTIILILISFSILLYAFPTGIVGKTLKNGTGCICHGAEPTPGVTVTIVGPDTLEVNQTGNFSVTISGGPLAAAGTNIAASEGVLTPGEGLRSEAGELTHVAPKNPINGVVTYNFTYTAPTAQSNQTLFANGNSVNLNGFNTGDQWNFAPNKMIVVRNLTAVKDENIVSSYSLDQNYPNPFNPSTKIGFNLPQADHVKLIIYNSIGVEVETLVNDFVRSGNHTITFNANNLASGIYYYRISTSKFSEIKKMVFLK